MEDKSKIAAIAAQLLSEADVKAKEEPKKKPRAPRKPAPDLSIVVNGCKDVEIVTGNKTVNNYHNVTPIQPNIIVQTGVGTISAQQKRQLLDWRDKVVEASAVRQKPKTPGSVMGALNKYMKVNSYHEILAEDFDKALNWMKKQVGTMHGMKSAPKKIEGWRTNRITAIHARSKEMGIVEWRIDYMQKKFGKVSLKELDDKELDAVYRAVMAKKSP